MPTSMFDYTLARILILLLLILLNGLFALAELAVVSSRRARLEHRARNGSSVARTTLEIVEDPTDFLSTVQIGITLIGIVAGAFSGATLAATLADWLTTRGMHEQTSGVISYVAIVTLVTYLSLTIGELIPKAIGLSNPERYAVMLVPPLRYLTLITLPVVRLLSFSTEFVTRLLRIDEDSEPPITEDEMKLLLEEGKEAGVFEPHEHRLVHRALDLDDIPIRQLMTRSEDIHDLLLTDDHDSIIQKTTADKHSYYPVRRTEQDDPHAIVRASELISLLAQTTNENVTLESIIHEPYALPETASPVQAIEAFRDSGLHIVFITGESGDFQGIVTPGNILEMLVGQLHEVG